MTSSTTKTARRPVRLTGGHWLLGQLPAFERPLRFLTAIGGRGPVVRFRLLHEDCYLVTAPEGVQQVLTGQGYGKDTPDFQILRNVLGEGLLTTDGSVHLQRRRLMQPAFHAQQLEQWGGMMAEMTHEMLAGWQDEQCIEMGEAMLHLTFRILGNALFGLDLARGDLQRSFDALNTYINQKRNPLLPPAFIPTPMNRQFKKAQRRLDQEIARCIALHRQQPEAYTDDILTFLLQIQQQTGALSDRQVRDELRTLVPAGHETTASALTWVWYLLEQHPSVEARLHEEVDRVLAGRLPTASAVKQLPFTAMVLDETLRLYPPAWLVTRRARENLVVQGYAIPQRALIFFSPWVTQHDPEVWPEPETFDPQRFVPELVSRRHRYAYFPFGGGVHKCIGEHFARQEGLLILASIAQRYRVRLRPEHPVKAGVFPALRPRFGLPIRLFARDR